MSMNQKILKTADVNIVADTREEQSFVIRHLSELKVNVIRKQLDVADYVCSERVGIERKTIPDFLKSITDQRIFRQAAELMEGYERPIFIIEGDPERLFETGIHPNTVRGVLASLATDYKMPILWTRHSRETANQIYWIAYREQVKEKKDLAVRVSKKSDDLPGQQQFLVSGLPFVNSRLSKRLLEKFKSPKKVFNAKEEQLMKVEGIGKDKARKIREILEKEYPE